MTDLLFEQLEQGRSVHHQHPFCLLYHITFRCLGLAVCSSRIATGNIHSWKSLIAIWVPNSIREYLESEW